MKIGSKYEFDEVFPRHWEQLCEKINYSYPAMQQLINKLTNGILIAALQEKQNLIEMNRNISVIEKIIQVFEKKSMGYFPGLIKYKN